MLEVYFKNMSAGNKRKLSLLCSFIGDTDIIALDEPTSNIDMVSNKAILNLIKKKGK